MLSSITPLGQRGRGRSWLRTAIAFWLGLALAGVSLFGALGGVGELAGLGRVAPVWTGGVLIIAGFLDLLGLKPPGPQRQVNEDWLERYRDWVTGLGFGAQLGVGFATIIPSFGIWALYLAAVFTGIPGAVAIGAGFAFGRGVLLVATRQVKSPRDLGVLMGRFARVQRFAVPGLIVGYLITIPTLVSGVV